VIVAIQAVCMGPIYQSESSGVARGADLAADEFGHRSQPNSATIAKR
jgi:hypothetical protein